MEKLQDVKLKKILMELTRNCGRMQLDIKTFSIYRLNRAKEDLEAAISNHQSGFYKVSINRAVSGSCRICRKSVEPRAKGDRASLA